MEGDAARFQIALTPQPVTVFDFNHPLLAIHRKPDGWCAHGSPRVQFVVFDKLERIADEVQKGFDGSRPVFGINVALDC